MLRLVLTLTGLALLSQVRHASAQTGVVKNAGLDQFISAVYRSSSAGISDARGSDDLSRNDLLKASCEKIMKEDMRITSLIEMKIDRVQHRSGKMKLQLRGVYTQGQALYFLLRMHNRSSLDYDVEAIHFFIADRSNGKTPVVRTRLVQSPLDQSASARSTYTELKPVYLYDSSSVVRGYGQATNVVVLPRFTLPYGKRLVIEVLEKNGGRQLQLQTTNMTLERARIL
ncbi:MAG TPA: DUF4138 domain-containing protein [Puia sp.]|jgi:hypothetical protein